MKHEAHVIIPCLGSSLFIIVSHTVHTVAVCTLCSMNMFIHVSYIQDGYAGRVSVSPFRAGNTFLRVPVSYAYLVPVLYKLELCDEILYRYMILIIE